LIHQKVIPKPENQNSDQMSNIDESNQKEVLKKEENEPGDPYSYSYLWLDLSMFHPC
jgi:hypothetical protein